MNSSLGEVISNSAFGSVIRIDSEDVLYTQRYFVFLRGCRITVTHVRLREIRQILYILTWCVAYNVFFFSNSAGK